MFENKSFRNIIILLIVIANIGCDQISKKIVRESVSPGDRIELINQNFLLMNVENNGAPWQFPAVDRLNWKDEV